MQSNDERVEQARSIYARLARESGAAARKAFPGAPSGELAPEEFLDRLTEAAFLRHAKLWHPFAVRLVNGGWSKSQLREWVRQDYQRIVTALRRHSLVAAMASDYETLRGLLARVKADADVDPVGGTFFALPQLWIKFGIPLGLSRKEIVSALPDPAIGQLNDAMLNEAMLSEARGSEAQASALPVGDLLDAALDPVFYQIWGETLERSLGLAHEKLDYFWAIAASRWGEETGRAILAQRAVFRESQAALWNQYRAEAEHDREWDRLSLLQKVLERGEMQDCTS